MATLFMRFWNTPLFLQLWPMGVVWPSMIQGTAFGTLLFFCNCDQWVWSGHRRYREHSSFSAIVTNGCGGDGWWWWWSAWFHDVWTCSAKVLEYCIIYSLKIKLYHSWKFQRNWNVPLVLLERSWWARFNGIYLVRFGFKMWQILIFKQIFPLKIQINSKKPGFGRKNQLRMR